MSLKAGKGSATNISYLNYTHSKTSTRVLLSPGRDKTPDYGTSAEYADRIVCNGMGSVKSAVQQQSILI